MIHNDNNNGPFIMLHTINKFLYLSYTKNHLHTCGSICHAKLSKCAKFNKNLKLVKIWGASLPSGIYLFVKVAKSEVPYFCKFIHV